MKYAFLVLMVLILPLAARAQTPVPKETANAYFNNCVNTASPQQDMSVQGQQMLCACTAARLTQFFTMEDWKAMTSTDPTQARNAYNHMMVDIYAPCMAEPTRERYMARCAKTNGLNQQICTCAADKIAFHMQNYGSSIFSNLLAANANLQDPWAALENDPSFNAYIDQATKECMPKQ